VTPARQKVGHFLRRNRWRIHNLLSEPISPRNLCTPKSASEKLNSDDHFPFRFMAMKGKPQNQKEKKGKKT